MLKEAIWKQEEFWVAVATAILVILNDGLGLGINPDPVLYIVALVFAWIVGNSVKKAAFAIREAIVTAAKLQNK